MRLSAKSCSSFVPIVETESPHNLVARGLAYKVAAHSFRLWKLKDRDIVTAFDGEEKLQLIRSDCGN